MLAQFGRLLRAVVDGPDPAAIPAPGEVIPTIDLARAPAEWDYSKAQYLYSGRSQQAAVVAEYALVGLQNPTGSDAVAVVTRMEFQVSDLLAVLYRGREVSVTWAQSGSEQARDGRLDNGVAYTRRPTCQVRGLSTGGVQGAEQAWLFPVWASAFDQASYVITEQFVVWPGQWIGWVPNTANRSNYGSVYWYERAFDRFEVQGVNPTIINEMGIG